MTQYAIIKKLNPDNMAEVEVMRGTACGDDCGSCEVCHYSSKIRVQAKNEIGAIPGDRVEIKTESAKVLGAAALVYIMPFILFFIGYAIAYSAGWSEGYKILASFVFFAVGLGIVVLVGRRKNKNPITYEITEIIGHGAAE